MTRFTRLTVLGFLGGCIQSAPPVDYSAAPLLHVTTCDDLIGHLKRQALDELDATDLQVGRSVPSRGWGDAAPISAPSAPGASAEAPDGSATAGPPSSFSETNVQVAGVDEADLVKTDGERIYYLSGGQLHVFRAWPASELSLEQSVAIEGAPIEMFVADGRVMIFSHASVLALDPAATRDCSGGFEPSIGADGSRPDIAFYCGGAYGQSATKVTELALGAGTAEHVRELYVPGTYHTARRHGDVVRLIARDDRHGGSILPTWLPPPSPEAWRAIWDRTDGSAIALAEWKAAARLAIENSDDADWLASLMVRQGDDVRSLPIDCRDAYVPSYPVTAGGTLVVSLELGSPEREPAVTRVWGEPDVVYAGAESLLITQQYATALPGAEPPTTDASRIHRFDLTADGRTVLTGTGQLPGRLYGQFALDERHGVVRAATTVTNYGSAWAGDTDVWEPPSTENFVYTLDASASDLRTRGHTEGLAKDERIFSVRYIDDMAYVVTFRQVDPLFAIDLSNADAPRVLGELKIPGFSTYMHPLSRTHLLTVGQEDGTGIIQIFDVTDPTDPLLAHKLTLDASDAWSTGLNNHKAFNYDATRGLLSLPLTSYAERYRSSLDLFEIDIATGIHRAGSLDHSDLSPATACEGFREWDGDCGGSMATMARGLFIDDFVFSMSSAAVRVHALADLSLPVATVMLPEALWSGDTSRRLGGGWAPEPRPDASAGSPGEEDPAAEPSTPAER